MNAKRIIVITLIVISVILLAEWKCSAILDEKPGNMVSTGLAERSAKRYLQENHPDSDYRISSVDYNDKDERYYVTLILPGSADSQFTLGYDSKGRMETNSYERMVTRKANTAIRLSDDYAAAVDKTLDTEQWRAAGWLQWNTINGSYDDSNCFFSDDLQLDGVYELSELGAKAGCLWVTVNVDSANAVTVEGLAESLLSIRKTMDEANLPFCKIDCRLQYANGTSSKRLEVEDFLYEKIYEQDMETRVEEALEK